MTAQVLDQLTRDLNRFETDSINKNVKNEKWFELVGILKHSVEATIFWIFNWIERFFILYLMIAKLLPGVKRILNRRRITYHSASDGSNVLEPIPLTQQ